MTKPLKTMAGATGLEPAASGVTGRRSNQLSYAPEIALDFRAFLRVRWDTTRIPASQDRLGYPRRVATSRMSRLWIVAFPRSHRCKNRLWDGHNLLVLTCMTKGDVYPWRP